MGLDPDTDSARFKRSLTLTVCFVALLWAIMAFESMGGFDFKSHGVYPRDPTHLQGILLAPLIHGSFAHLFANTPALLVLGTSILYGYPRAARIMIPLIYAGSGLGVWTYGREAYHIGASGLTFGLMFFVFTIGALRWDRRASALSMLVFFLYGGMIWGIFPQAADISFEYHFFGAAIGVSGAVLLRRLDPLPEEKKYSWESQDDNDDDPYWLRNGDALNRDSDPDNEPGNRGH